MARFARSRVPDVRPAATLAAINAYAEEHAAGAVECCVARGKGRVLLAKHDFKPGDLVMRETPIQVVYEEPGNAAFQALRVFCAEWEDAEDDVQWYWCGLRSLGSLVATDDDEALGDVEWGRLLLLHDGGTGSSRPSRRTVEVARQFAPQLTDAAVLERCLQVWKLNSFDHSDDHRGIPGAALYFLPSFMSHSCFPSAVWHTDRVDGGSFVLRARRAIAVGEEVTVTYLDEYALLDHAVMRRSELFASKDFWCGCERCSAPKDATRGFRCPCCHSSSVFARTPHRQDWSVSPGEEEDGGGGGGGGGGDEDEDEDDGLGAIMRRRIPCLARAEPVQAHGSSVRLLSGATCDACHHALSLKEASSLLEAEEELQALLELWRGRGKPPTLEPPEVRRAEELLSGPLTQHGCSFRARKILAKHYSRVGDQGKQAKLLQEYAALAKITYQGLCAARAWALEASADALLQCPLRRRDDAGAMACFSEALQILSPMFGCDHEDVQELRGKLLTLRRRSDDSSSSATIAAARQ